MPLTGKVYEFQTHIALPQVKVRNTNTKDNTLTNALGIFNIKAKPGDILILEAFNYKPDTVVVVNARYIEVYLVPQNNTLKEVNIKNTSTKLGNLKETSFHNQAVVYQTDANGVPKGGIAIRFGYGKSKKEKRDEQFAYNNTATKEIDQNFSADNVSKYIPLRAEELKQFVGLYRPTIRQYKAPNFNLTLYLNDCYKKFKALPADQRKLAPLKGDLPKG
jgi:hypothetical protein